MERTTKAGRVVAGVVACLLALGLAGCAGGQVSPSVKAPSATAAGTGAAQTPGQAAASAPASSSPSASQAAATPPASPSQAAASPAPSHAQASPAATAARGIDGRWCPTPQSLSTECVTVKFPKLTTDSGKTYPLTKMAGDDGVMYSFTDGPFGVLYPAGTPITSLGDYPGADHRDQDRVWSSQGLNMLLRSAKPRTVPAVKGFPDQLQGTWCAKGDAKGCFSLASLKADNPGLFLSYSSKSEDVPGATDFSLCLTADAGPGECSTAASMYLRYFPVGLNWNCANLGKVGKLPYGFTSCKPDYSSAHDPSKPRLLILPSHQQSDQYVDSVPMYQVG